MLFATCTWVCNSYFLFNFWAKKIDWANKAFGKAASGGGRPPQQLIHSERHKPPTEEKEHGEDWGGRGNEGWNCYDVQTPKMYCYCLNYVSSTDLGLCFRRVIHFPTKVIATNRWWPPHDDGLWQHGYYPHQEVLKPYKKNPCHPLYLVLPISKQVHEFSIRGIGKYIQRSE